MAGLMSVKDWAFAIFAGAERRGVFHKLPAFERDLSEYPELAVLARNYAIIRAECEALVRSQMRIPGMDELTSYTSGGIHQIAWKSFMFKSGDFIEENCALAPKTAALLARHSRRLYRLLLGAGAATSTSRRIGAIGRALCAITWAWSFRTTIATTNAGSGSIPMPSRATATAPDRTGREILLA